MPSRGPHHDLRGLGLALELAGSRVATVQALGPAGMRIETDAQLEPGQLLDFELRPPHSRVKFAASGVVLAVRRRGARLEVRIRFDRLRLRLRGA